jgi:hypothetical protein
MAALLVRRGRGLTGAARGRVPADLPPDFPAERVALVDLLDRVLAEGVVVTGDITLSIADVDLVTVSLRALLASVSTLNQDGGAS